MIRLILFILLLFLLFTLSYTNSQETVPIYYFWGLEYRVRMDFLILVSGLSGMFLALVFLLPGWIRMRLEIRRKRRYIEQIETERDHLRAGQVGAATRPRSPLSPEEEIDEY